MKESNEVENIQCGGGGDNHPQIQWNPAAKQLYNAIMLLIIFFDSKPDQTLFKLKKKVVQYSGCPPYASRVRAVNTILRKANRNMSEIIEILSRENNIRAYDFALLEQILKDENEENESYF